MNEKNLKKIFGLLRANKNDVFKYVIKKGDYIYSNSGPLLIRLESLKYDKRFSDFGAVENDGLYEIGFATDQLYQFVEPYETDINLAMNFDSADALINCDYIF